MSCPVTADQILDALMRGKFKPVSSDLSYALTMDSKALSDATVWMNRGAPVIARRKPGKVEFTVLADWRSESTGAGERYRIVLKLPAFEEPVDETTYSF
jgi:hypothetical protein